MSFDIATTANADYIDAMYEKFRADPNLVDGQWQAFFAGFELGARREGADEQVIQSADEQAESAGEREAMAFLDAYDTLEEYTRTDMTRQQGAMALVNAYRAWGHMIADIAPMSYTRPPYPLLELAEYGFTEDDLDQIVGNGGFNGPTDGTLRDLVAKLGQTYCGSVAVEYTEIPYKSQHEWLEQRMEPILNRPKFSAEQCRDLLGQLIEAREFEQFLHTKYIGRKRFSIEGGEALLPMLHAIIETGAALNVEEIVMGMAHRGRLNVLTHVMHKPYAEIFSEFEGVVMDRSEGSGDVKYHMGYAHEYITRDGREVHLGLTPNPSHLELVNPVIEGIVCTKQETKGDIQHEHIVPLIIHGDAAFAGQGIVPETICLSHLDGYDNGGTIHIVVNNQIGFTALPRESRFTSYPTDVAKIVKMPIFHVNGDDPEAVVHAARLAMAYRQAVKNDVIIDLWCYRRYGHNESDDPAFTQPLQYAEIAAHPTVVDLYANRLIEQNIATEDDVAAMKRAVREKLDAGLVAAKTQTIEQPRGPSFGGAWQGYGKAGADRTAKTAVPAARLIDIAQKATAVPEGFHLYRKLARQFDYRMQMVNGNAPMDWGCAEMLAFGSLLVEGYSVRLAGQDSQRGTFSHRQAVWHDVKTGALYSPLNHLSDDQAGFRVYNTMLSELAVLGFEFGVSYANPKKLTIWEAQFGDFVNGAQAIIDQFISSSEAKWEKMSGLVMLLPHGFEGQGPEHSSARLERFQALCAEDNMQVGCPTLPAQYFHLLRRQMLREFRKPLILMMPKSLLRHKESTSAPDDLASGAFSPVLDDPAQPDPSRVERVVFCTGKVFFDLKEGRDQKGEDRLALVRIEEHYPFPWDDVGAILDKYPDADIFWGQEEPQNMGSWDFMEPKIRRALADKKPVHYIGRKPTAATATGIQSVHLAEQREIVETTLDF